MQLKFFRWKAVVPLSLLLALGALVWILYLDVAVEHAIERLGSELVGAKVELGAARVSLARGEIVLSELAVTNPDRPLTNLFEVDEIVADIAILPLLEKKLVVETLALRGVRFATDRETSGALERSGESGLIARQVSDWASQVTVPEFSLASIGSLDRLSQLSVDDLSSVRHARQIESSVDSLRRQLSAQVSSLDPSPTIDSARALLDRLEGASPLRLGITGIVDAATSLRSTIRSVNTAVSRLQGIETMFSGSVSGLRRELAELENARRADYQYALGLLNLPSLDTPDLSPNIFNRVIAHRLQPILYWVAMADRYMPPGLDPKRRPGPKRPRRAGTTVVFPDRTQRPRFLLELAEATVEIGGTGAAAGNYAAKLTGLTTEPVLYGHPMRLEASREGGSRGPRSLGVTAVLNHVGAPVTDSVNARLLGVPLPSVNIAIAGARLEFGRGITELALVRSGDSLLGSLRLRSNNVTWTRSDGERGGVGADFLWSTLAAVRSVAVQVSISGSVSSPRLRVSSNVGRQLAAAVRQRLGAEIARAESSARAEVERLVREPVATAISGVSGLQEDVLSQVADRRAELDQVKVELEQRLRQLTGGILGIGR